MKKHKSPPTPPPPKKMGNIKKTYTWCILYYATVQRGWPLLYYKVNKSYNLSARTDWRFLINTPIRTHLMCPNGVAPLCFMSRTVVQPSLIPYTGWRRIHQDNRWWMASKWGWRRHPINQQCSGHHVATQAYFTLCLERKILSQQQLHKYIKKEWINNILKTHLYNPNTDAKTAQEDEMWSYLLRAIVDMCVLYTQMFNKDKHRKNCSNCGDYFFYME